MSRVLTVCFLVVANLAIPATSFAATITVSNQMFYFTDGTAITSRFSADMVGSYLIELEVNGAAVIYEPEIDCHRLDITTMGMECERFEIDVGELSVGQSTVTVTAAAPVEGDGEGESSGNCDLSTDEALEIWLSYFFVSWGIMIPVFVAALSVGAIAKVIRGNR